jgi:hypothetical protein
VGTRDSCPEVKGPGHEADHWPLSSVEVKNQWSCYLYYPIRLQEEHSTNVLLPFRSSALPLLSTMHRISVGSEFLAITHTHTHTHTQCHSLQIHITHTHL